MASINATMPAGEHAVRSDDPRSTKTLARWLRDSILWSEGMTAAARAEVARARAAGDTARAEEVAGIASRHDGVCRSVSQLEGGGVRVLDIERPHAGMATDPLFLGSEAAKRKKALRPLIRAAELDGKTIVHGEVTGDEATTIANALLKLGDARWRACFKVAGVVSDVCPKPAGRASLGFVLALEAGANPSFVAMALGANVRPGDGGLAFLRASMHEARRLGPAVWLHVYLDRGSRRDYRATGIFYGRGATNLLTRVQPDRDDAECVEDETDSIDAAHAIVVDAAKVGDTNSADAAVVKAKNALASAKRKAKGPSLAVRQLDVLVKRTVRVVKRIVHQSFPVGRNQRLAEVAALPTFTVGGPPRYAYRGRLDLGAGGCNIPTAMAWLRPPSWTSTAANTSSYGVAIADDESACWGAEVVS